jgi:uncharacterized protein
MTPEERDLITTLLDRLKSITGQPKDTEADRLIRQAMGRMPDAPYYLVQTVLIQDITLHQAEARIAELEEQLAATDLPQSAPTSFLGGLFGRGQRAQSSGAMPSTGSRDHRPEEPQAGPQYSQSSYPSYGRPGDAPGSSSPGPTAGGGFLRSAATTAAGLAGGALLAQGISSMFGRGSANSPFGGMRMTPGGAATANRDSASQGDYGGGDYGGGGEDETDDGDYGGGDEGGEDYGGGDESGEDYGGGDEGGDCGGGDEGDEDYGGDSDAGGDFGGGGDPSC